MIRNAALWHPLMVSIAPILLLAAANNAQIELNVLWLPLAAVLVLAAMLGAVLRWMVGNHERSALLTSLSMVVFLSHGHLHRAIVLTSAAPRSRYVHLMLLTVWLIMIAGAWWGLHRWKRSVEPVTRFVTVVATLLVVMGLAQLGLGYPKEKVSSQSVFPEEQLDRSRRREPQSDSDLPDIYYLILDGYGRQDQLAQLCDYENTEFLQFLEDSGFYVAEKSHSNYATTFLSLASSLNLRFVNREAEIMGRHSDERGPLYELIRNNDVARYLQVHGYRFIHLNSTYGATARCDVADVAIPPTPPEFNRVLQETTLLKPFSWKLASFRQGAASIPDLNRYHFRYLKEIPQVDVPTFTFAHIVCPHGPYYFDREGNTRSEAEAEYFAGKKRVLGGRNLSEGARLKNRASYVDQLVYLNRQMRGIVERILTQSDRPPIIVLQADHGTDFLLDVTRPVEEQPRFIEERMSILNAYYVPASCRSLLYESITPVNTFRVLLNEVFGEELPLVPDRVFFSWYVRPYDLVDVSDHLASLDKVGGQDTCSDAIK